MALINSSPDSCQSKLEITVFILVGCLGYSNSAMNPILYAFLSDNFKKSFMKAFTCTKTKVIFDLMSRWDDEIKTFNHPIVQFMKEIML